MLQRNFDQQREQLVRQLERQGITDPAVLEAMRGVRREAFIAPELQEFAYRNTPLPIAKDQTISQPLIVAMMTMALELKPGDRVLEIGAGSGYAAAVLGSIAKEVYTVERHAELAETAQGRLQEQGFDNVHVLHADGTLGWPEHAPYDAIIVAAGGPDVPVPLLEQLRTGGRLVIPVGRELDEQKLLRIRKGGPDDYEREDLGDVRFVPLVGAAGWGDGSAEPTGNPIRVKDPPRDLTQLLRQEVESFDALDDCDLTALLQRIGDSRLVLIGEATHGTSEFYRMRARITQELIERRGFAFVAVEADWPDAARINHYVQHVEIEGPPSWQTFARFPTWMWRNHEVLEFVEWLHRHNQQHHESEQGVGFYGLDLYSLYTSISAVLQYLDRVDPEAARTARQRYGCLSPWEGDPQTYGRAAISGRYADCEREVAAILQDLLSKRMQYAEHDGLPLLNAEQNARVVTGAERYYRIMYYGGAESWNLRDQHMFDALQALLDYHGVGSKGIVWAHNSHLGDAAATEMGAQGEINIGHLCRQYYGQDAYLIGQGTDHGTVAAASSWDAPVETMRVRPSHRESYERLCHDCGVKSFLLPVRDSDSPAVGQLQASRLERAIGVIYRPQTELHSHYFHASLPNQFDEWIWFDKSHAVRPILEREARRHRPAHPFALID